VTCGFIILILYNS